VKKCELVRQLRRLHNALTLFLFLRSARFLRGSTRWSFRASSTTAGSGGRDYGDYGDCGGGITVTRGITGILCMCHCNPERGTNGPARGRFRGRERSSAEVVAQTMAAKPWALRGQLGRAAKSRNRFFAKSARNRGAFGDLTETAKARRHNQGGLDEVSSQFRHISLQAVKRYVRVSCRMHRRGVVSRRGSMAVGRPRFDGYLGPGSGPKAPPRRAVASVAVRQFHNGNGEFK
jgi:hypothetical protein